MTTRTKAVRRVLVVDDDLAIVRLVSLSLELDGGFTTASANSGVAALALLDAEQFDAVVLDLNMPGMGGAEVYQELRIRGNLIPVLILTAYGKESLPEAVSLVSVVHKPFDVDDLIVAVEAILDDELNRAALANDADSL